MMGRMAVFATVIALAGCAGMESVGRNAQRADVPPHEPMAPAETAAPAPPAQSAPPPAPAQTASAEDAEPEEDDSTIVVPGQREMQVQPPAGDPRSVAERMEDVRAWDRCITRSQSAAEGDPMRPQLDT